jgi:hypothetical protein
LVAYLFLHTVRLSSGSRSDSSYASEASSRSSKNYSKTKYNFEYNPRILVADSAKSITKGFKRVFDLKFQIDCWAHVDRNIVKNMKKHINKHELRKAIKADIDVFQNNVASKETGTQAINKTKTNSKPNAKNSGFTTRK